MIFITAKLDICRTRVREALQDRGLFRLVDDAGARGSDSGTLNRGMAKDVDDGLVDPGNLQYAGTYAAADFRMLGSLRRVSDGGSHYFVLNIRLYDLRSREFWTSTKILEKF